MCCVSLTTCTLKPYSFHALSECTWVPVKPAQHLPNKTSQLASALRVYMRHMPITQFKLITSEILV